VNCSSTVERKTILAVVRALGTFPVRQISASNFPFSADPSSSDGDGRDISVKDTPTKEMPLQA
jgi:hypothetical protein